MSIEELGRDVAMESQRSDDYPASCSMKTNEKDEKVESVDKQLIELSFAKSYLERRELLSDTIDK